ncbi:MAG: 1-deoxy-D-xylulose-5-phosphate reductoisomerase [Atopobiaceae bacterium]|nr:1-deoxy-D-xylulose-5-phosphate reductoisomerase [Atopobiaceae bacterium]
MSELFGDFDLHRKGQPLRLAILGCTGSIGSQAIDICRRYPERVQLVAASAHSQLDKLLELAQEFSLAALAVTDETLAGDERLSRLSHSCELSFGEKALNELAERSDVDCVLVAVTGLVGIWSTYAALCAGKRVACANKEALVAGGDILMQAARPGQLIPVDSEHNAIYQCLVGEDTRYINRLWITCSGGPFWGWSREALAQATPEQALAHPNWAMGDKITVDSATLMNKGLEVIEAHHLFSMDYDKISVVIHRQSKIHSMVEFADGSVKAQIGPSDMRIPIQYALSYPERWDAPAEPVDFLSLGDLSFSAPDVEVFRALRLALDAGRTGGSLPCVMNAANEIANEAFRQGTISLVGIDEVVERVMDAHDTRPLEDLDHIRRSDAWARTTARELVKELSC